MGLLEVAAVVYALTTAGVVAFQIALAAGAPLGEYAMGGARPGAFSAGLRVTAVVQAALLGAMAALVLSRVGLILPAWQDAGRTLIWGVVAFNVLAVVLNAMTRSVKERALWLPVTLVMLVCVLAVALRAT